ncbi:Kazal domain-containing protein [Methyloceanibacter sp.]|uniref:Kazal domain-containing protein n=1 Tax=Methyloceanibacter sp. TaxID=1965321 RepID=UPI003D6C7BF0
MCGGFAGLPCSDKEWCNFPIGANCGVGDQSGVCRPRPDKCTEQFVPVCACNNQTYGSACSAAQAGFDVAYFGPCRK